MDEAKKKRLDDRLKQLIAESDSAQNDNNNNNNSNSNRPAKDTSSQSRASGNVSVIRRRKGKPDHSIVS